MWKPRKDDGVEGDVAPFCVPVGNCRSDFRKDELVKQVIFDECRQDIRPQFIEFDRRSRICCCPFVASILKP